MSDQAFPIIHLSGAPYDMGVQHGQQVAPLLPAILASIAAREAQLQQDAPGPHFMSLVRETVHLLQRVNPAMLSQIYGIADSLEIPRARLVHYNLVPFLRDAFTTRRRLNEGCTTWAAVAPITAGSEPILVKNRDYTLEHVPLQIVVRAEPRHGHRYTYLTSAGSPGVFVAGFNETGLAIVDTHVPSLDVGPGLPAYALATIILEEHDDVRTAVAYLRATPRLGRNNFLLADNRGDIVAFEIGHRHNAVLEASEGLLVTTNHFNSLAMRPMFVDTEPPALHGNSFRRYQRVSKALREAQGQVDVAFAKGLMALHAGPLDAICRHPCPESDTSTIATTIFLPQQHEMQFCLGQPCTSPFHTLRYD